jgi:hypothetical protein
MGSSTAFLTGFVDAANRNMYETRMAAHQESVEARADFQWKERNTEAIARQDKLIADNITLENQRLEDSRAFDITDAEREREEQEDRDKEELSKRLIALNPEFANNPEALAKALLAGRDGLHLYTNSKYRYRADGSLISARDIVDEDTKEYVMASAPLSWRDNPAWMNTEAAIEFAERVRSEGGRSGLATFNDAGMSFENILDEEGAVIGSRIARAQDQGEPWEVKQIEINTARDHIMSHLSNIPGLTGIDMIDGNFRVDNPALFSGIDTMVQNTIRRYAELKTTQEGQYAIVTQVANQILSEQLEGFLGYAKAANTLGSIANEQKVSLEDKMESLAYLEGAQDRLGVQAVLASMTAEEQGQWRSRLANPNVEGGVDVPGAETTGEEVVDQGFTIEEVPTGTGLSAQTRKIYTLDEVGLNKMSEAYELHASQPPPKRQRDSLIPIERYIADLFGFNHLMPMDQIAIDQLIKQHEDLISLGVIETNGD